MDKFSNRALAGPHGNGGATYHGGNHRDGSIFTHRARNPPTHPHAVPEAA